MFHACERFVSRSENINAAWLVRLVRRMLSQSVRLDIDAEW